MNRRNFMRNGVLTSAFVGGILPFKPFLVQNKNTILPRIKFGVCTDIHHDLYPNVPERLSEFVEDMRRKNADFIIQLGDFCMPKPENKIILDIYNKFSNIKLHVLGNHDTEKEFSKDEVIKFWGSIDKYYSLDVNDYHIIVLDGNEINPSPLRNCKINYERYVSKEQLSWLENDINETNLPTIIFIHQSLDHDAGLENSCEVRAILDRCNQRAGFKKVLMVISGHHHLDYHNIINGIHHIQINSMCYKWLGNRYAESPYSKEINDKFPLLSKMSHYKDSLYAFFEISENGILKITGKQSNFLGKSPQKLGMPEFLFSYPVVPKISNRVIQL